MAKRYVETGEAIQLDWQALGEMDQGGCYLVALPWAGLSVLLSLLRYAGWRTRWRTITDDAEWQDITDFIHEVEACLIMGCDVRELIDAVKGTSDKLAFELSCINYNLDRIRDNLDSITPDGGTAEFGLATIFAALGPNVTAATEYLKNINAAVNSDVVNIPDEATDFVETGENPALGDDIYADNRLSGVTASRGPQNRINLTITVTVPGSVIVVKKMEFLVEVKNSLGSSTGIIIFDVSEGGISGYSDYSCVLTEPDFTIGDASITGTVTVMDYFLNMISDTY